MRFLDFRFNGLTIEPVIELSSSEKSGAQINVNNIKSIGEAKRLLLTLEISIKAMEKKEQEDAQLRIATTHAALIEQEIALSEEEQKLDILKQEFYDKYDIEWNVGTGCSNSPRAAEQT